MSDELTLFDLGADSVPQEPGERLSAGRRLTIRQKQALAHGSHPLALLTPHLGLHADAAPADDRKAAGFRCGGCEFLSYNERDYPKCQRGQTGEIGTPSFRRGPYETHSNASDVRLWWPACTYFKPMEAEA